MDELRGYAYSMGSAGAPNSSEAGHAQQHPVNGGTCHPSASPMRKTVVMAKKTDERSFGMTLEQTTTGARVTEHPRVSSVFQNTPASRAGIRAGWKIEFINGASCLGCSVHDVANVIRDLTQVTLYVNTSSEIATPLAPPSFLLAQERLTQPRPMLPLGGATFASLLPPNMPGSSSTMTPSVPMRTTTTTTATAITPAIVSSSHATTLTGTTTGSNGHATLANTVAPPQTAQASLPQVTQSNGHVTASTPTVPVVSPPTAVPVAPAAPMAPATPAAPVGVMGPTIARTTAAPETPTVPVALVAPVHQPSPPVLTTPAPSPAPPLTPSVTSHPPAQSVVRAAPPPSAQQPQPVPTLPVRIAQAATLSAPSVTSSLPPPAQAALPTPSPISQVASTASSTTATATAAPAVGAAALAPPVQEESRSTGKRRSRVTTATPTTTPPTTGKKRARPAKRQASPAADAWYSDDGGYVFASDDNDDDDDELEVFDSPPPASASGTRRQSTRQAETGGRKRRSLTVARLMTMGFTEEDALASVVACGQNPDKCMLWIVSHLEEKQFLNDLNKASIESEQQKRLDAQEQKKQESETLRQTTAFTSLFQTSYILCNSAEAPQLHEMLSSTIGEIGADTLMRTLMTKLLTVESKAIRWYKEASKCYMLQLAARLETAFATHDAVACCAQLMATQPASMGCSFVRALHEEEQALTKALFAMPENHGGVPLQFLSADESMQFDLEDDGFEVVNPPQQMASPDHD